MTGNGKHITYLYLFMVMTGGWFMTLFCPHYPKGGAILEPSEPWFTMRSFQWHSACPWNSTICGLGIKRVAGLWTHLQRCGGMGFQLHSVVGGGGMVVGWWWDGGGMGWDFELQGRVVVCFVILHDIFSRNSFPNKLMTIPRGLFQIMSQVFVRHGSLFMASHH